jgi:hypothetical protein
MADEKSGPTAPGGKRRRPAPTIDLKATEIASDPVKPSEPVDPPPETRRADAPPTAPAEPGAPNEAAAAASSRPRWRPEWPERAAMADWMSAWRDRAAERANWRLVAAGGAGVAVLAVFAALWAFTPGGTRGDPVGAIAARLATVESQVRDFAARPQPTGVDQRAVADLAARVGAAEQTMGRLNDFDARIAKAEAAAAAPRPAPQPDQALTGRVAALEAATRSLAELTQRADAASAAAREARSRADAAFEAAQKTSAVPAAQAADHKEIEALAARAAALEQAAKSVDEKIARAAASAGADRPGRLAFVAVTLRSAVERGEPFAQELAAAKPLVPDAAALAALEPFAATGVPRGAALARELSALTAPMLSAAGSTPRDGGIIDRLQQNAERLVRIRPVNEAPGDDAATVIARAEAKAAHGNIAGAMSELSQLPAPARAPAQAWIKKAEAQVAALAAVRRIAESAVGALATP